MAGRILDPPELASDHPIPTPYDALDAVARAIGPILTEVIAPIFFEPDPTHVTRWTWDHVIPPAGVPFQGLTWHDPTKIPGAGTWDDVWDWVYNGFQSQPDIPPAELDLANVIRAFQAPLERIVQTLATNISLIGEFMRSTFARDHDAFRSMFISLVDLTFRTQDRLDHQQATLDAITALALPSLQAQIAAQEQRSRYVDTVIVPALAQRIQNQDDQLEYLRTQVIPNLQQQITNNDEDAKHGATITDAVNTAINAARLATSAWGAARSAFDWFDNVGNPLDDSIGPKTDLGKFLKLLKIAELAGLFAELAALDRAGVEGLLRGLQDFGSSAIVHFGEMFVDGGATVGETIAANVV